MTQTNQEKILVLCAHNDDQIIGAGGTLVKYNKKGIPFKTVIFSFGEGSHPHIKQHLVVETRVREALKSDKILGGNGIAFFGIKEGKFKEEFKAKKIKQRVEWTINQENPTRIFTHSDDDFHPDHKAVYYLVKELIDEKKINCEVYSFDIWNVVKLKKRNYPRMVVDITNEFDTKMDSLLVHKSQKVAIFTLFANIYLKAVFNGWRNGFRFAEVFRKLK